MRRTDLPYVWRLYVRALQHYPSTCSEGVPESFRLTQQAMLHWLLKHEHAREAAAVLYYVMDRRMPVDIDHCGTKPGNTMRTWTQPLAG